MTFQGIAGRLALIAAATALLAAGPAMAAKKPKAGAGAGAAAAPEKPFADWKKTTKDAEKIPGYITLWKKRDNLYAEVTPEQLGQPFLGVFTLSRGIGQNFIVGGLPINEFDNDRLLEFQRHGDRVLLVQKNVRFETPAGVPMANAMDLSIGHSVLASMKIESEHDSSKALLVDLGSVVVSDVSDLAEWMRGWLNNKSVRFEKDRSSLGAIKNFPGNTEIEVNLTYAPNDRTNFDLEAVPDVRYMPLGVHYSFVKLPEQPMQPRLGDERVGFFVNAKKDFSRDDQENFWRRYIIRWRLEKKDPAAALSEPVKPIVYYIDHTVPELYRPWVKEGVEAWQKAFEAAGFRNAIVAMDPPADDPNWDAEDTRYSTIRWSTSHIPAYGAIGPCRRDPRTGEILDADVLMEASMFQGFRNEYRIFGDSKNGEAYEIGRKTLPYLQFEDMMEKGLKPAMACLAGQALADGGALGRTFMLLNGMIQNGQPVPDRFLREAVIWVTMHEVGHTLGLEHNFRSSTSTPMSKLHDVAWTREHGLYSSVMEYPNVNISPDPSKQGQYYTTGPGTYDTWAIRYGYTPSGAADVDADHTFATRIADESLQPGHEYSTGEDTYPAHALDPRSNIFDLGDDPLGYARMHTELVSKMWRNPKLEESIVRPDEDPARLRRALSFMAGEYAGALGVAVKYVGGQYSTRARRGQPNAVDPLQVVPAAKQREALDFLAQRAFAADAWKIDPAVMNRAAPDRWAHWGMPNAYGQANARLDFNWNDFVFSVQSQLVGGLTHPALLSRLRQAESRSKDAFRLSDHFAKMTTMLWGEVGGGEGTAAAFKALAGPHTRRQVQRHYVDRLAAMVAAPPAGAPDDARALARLQLTRIDGRCSRALAAGAIGDDVRAHLIESRARIARALEASREADAPRPGGMGNAIAE